MGFKHTELYYHLHKIYLLKQFPEYVWNLSVRQSILWLKSLYGIQTTQITNPDMTQEIFEKRGILEYSQD